MRFTRWENLLASLERPLVFFDTETTSPNPKHAKVVEFAVAAYGPASLLDGSEPDAATLAARERSLIPGLLFAATWRATPGTDPRTDRGLARAARIHGITADMLVNSKGQPLPGVLLPYQLKTEVDACLSAGYPCGFNSVEYDDVVLHGEGRCQPHVVNPLRTRVDVLRVYRGVTGRTPRAEVSGIRRVEDPSDMPQPVVLDEGTTELHRDTLSAGSRVVLGVRHEGAHGGLSDSMRSAEVLAGLMELWPKTCPGSIDGLELLTLDPGPPWCGWDRMLKLELGEWVFMKGEHRGLALAEVDRGYLGWMCGRGRGKKPDFEAGTVREIERHLAGQGPSPRYLGADVAQ